QARTSEPYESRRNAALAVLRKTWDGMRGAAKSSAHKIDSFGSEKDCLCGRDFPFGPDGAVAEEFLLPNRDAAFERIDAEAAGVECGGAMRGADRNQHRGLTDFKPAKPVNHRETPDREFLAHLGADFPHFGQGHRLVGFVLQIQRGTVAGMVAYDAFEHHHGAIGGRFKLHDNL